MNNYNERIVHFREGLTLELNMHELTVKINEGLGLYVEIKTDLFTQTLPPLRGGIDEQTVAELQSYKKEMTFLLHKIAEEKIGNKFEKLFSEYLTEELKNPRNHTMKKELLERESKELKRLFLSIDNTL